MKISCAQSGCEKGYPKNSGTSTYARSGVTALIASRVRICYLAVYRVVARFDICTYRVSGDLDKITYDFYLFIFSTVHSRFTAWLRHRRCRPHNTSSRDICEWARLI